MLGRGSGEPQEIRLEESLDLNNGRSQTQV